jgi:hypothetical protein
LGKQATKAILIAKLELLSNVGDKEAAFSRILIYDPGLPMVYLLHFLP